MPRVRPFAPFYNGRSPVGPETRRLHDAVAALTDVTGLNSHFSPSSGLSLRPPAPEEFLARITEKEGSSPIRYGFVQVVANGDGTYTDRPEYLQGYASGVFAVERTNQNVPVDSIVVVKQGEGFWNEDYPNEFFEFTYGGGGSGFWARIYAKTYPSLGDPAGTFTKYSWVRANDSLDPKALSWRDDEPTQGSASSYPAYEVMNVDLPVDEVSPDPAEPATEDTLRDAPFIVWLTPGDGAYYLFEQTPRWEFVEKTGDAVTISGTLYYPGKLLRYDQGSKSWVQTEDVYIIDANSP